MKHSIYTQKTVVNLWLATAAVLVLGIHSVRSIVRLTKFETPYALIFFLLALALVSFAAAYKMIEQLTECIGITDESLTYYVLFRKVSRIRWSDIKETGVGQIYTPAGTRYCIFFSKSPLSDEEVDNLELAKHKCIYLNRLTEENYEIIRKHCPECETKLIEKWIREKPVFH